MRDYSRNSRVNDLIIDAAAIFLVFFSGCTSQLLRDEIIDPTSNACLEIINSSHFVNGKGYISYTGQESGRLSFTFSSTPDSLYIMFKDIFSRKTLFIQIENETLEVWDIIGNQHYADSMLPNLLPLPESISAGELISIFRGCITADGTTLFSDFTYAESDVGLAIKKTVIRPSKDQYLEIHFYQRQWGYPENQITTRIPDSVPRVEFN